MLWPIEMDEIKRFRLKFTIDRTEKENMTITEEAIIAVLQREMRGTQYSFVEVWETDENWEPKW